MEDLVNEIVAGSILRELQGQIIAPERIIKLRICLYSELKSDYLWSNIHYTIKQLKNEGIVKTYQGWLYSEATLSEYGMEYIEAEYSRKYEVYRRWNTAASQGGYLLERLITNYLRSEGIDVVQQIVRWNGKELRIDIYSSDYKLAMEVKNVFSDTYVNPEAIKYPNQDHQQLIELFRYCKRRGFTPILMAPLIDDSFYYFAERYNGLCCRTLVQVVDADKAGLVREIKDEFQICHVKATNRLPSHIAKWLERHVIEPRLTMYID